MIITEQLITNLGACQEAVDWCRVNNLYGQSRGNFIRSLKDAGAPDFYIAWSAEILFSAPALKLASTYTYLDNYRVISPLDVSDIFTTLEEAQTYQSNQQNAYHASETHIFHVHARDIVGIDGYTAEMCNIQLDTAPDADYYASFTHETGQYERFDTYEEAQAHALNLKQSRKTLTDQMFRLQRQVAGPEGELDWDEI
jgi:hypothetical protein